MTSASVRLVRSEKKTETGRQTSESRDRQQRKSVCHAHTRTRISAWGEGPVDQSNTVNGHGVTRNGGTYHPSLVEAIDGEREEV